MQGRLGITRDRIQSEVFTHVCAELGRIRHVVIIIADRLLPRRQQLERGYRYVGGPEMRDIESIVDPVLRAAEAGRLVESAKRSAFERRGRARRAFAFLGNDRNHTAKRVRAIEPALGSSQHFDLLDIRRQQLAQIERTVWVAGIAGVDAVDQNFGVI